MSTVVAAVRSTLPPYPCAPCVLAWDVQEAFQAALQASPDGPEARAYRTWMLQVLQPLNERAAQVGACGTPVTHLGRYGTGGSGCCTSRVADVRGMRVPY